MLKHAAPIAATGAVVAAFGVSQAPASGPAPSPSLGPPPVVATAPTSDNEVVEQYCVRCHNDRRLLGNMSLEEFDASDAPGNGELAERMIRKLRAGLMPPPGARRPDEETLLGLLDQVEQDDAYGTRRLRVAARAEAGDVELEFLAVAGEGNIEDRMALAAGHATEIPVEQDFSLRLLRHIATSVRHQKYHDTDIVTVRVAGEAG